MGADSGIEQKAIQNVELAAAAIRRLLAARGRAAVVVDGSLPHDFFAAFAAQPDIDWTQVIVFLTGEYLGASAEAEDSLRRQVVEHLLRRAPIVEFHAPRGEAANPAAVVSNYAARLETLPPDLALLGPFAALLPEVGGQASVAIVEIEGKRAIALTTARLRHIPLVFRFDDAGL